MAPSAPNAMACRWGCKSPFCARLKLDQKQASDGHSFRSGSKRGAENLLLLRLGFFRRYLVGDAKAAATGVAGISASPAALMRTSGATILARLVNEYQFSVAVFVGGQVARNLNCTRNILGREFACGALLLINGF